MKEQHPLAPPAPPATQPRMGATGVARNLRAIGRWTVRAVAGALVFGLLLGVMCVFFAYSPSGGPTLARLTSGLVNGLDTGITVEIGAIHVQWPLTLSVQDIRLRDQQGEWIHAPQADVTVRPASLIPTWDWQWHIGISKALVRQATWTRLPEPPPNPMDATASPTVPQPLTLLPAWLSITADTIVLEQTRIGTAALALSPANPYIPTFSTVQLAVQGTVSALTAHAEIHAEIRPEFFPSAAPIAEGAPAPLTTPENPAAPLNPNDAAPKADTAAKTPSPVTRLQLEADWANNTLSLNTRIEDTALLAPHLPQPTLPTLAAGDMPKGQTTQAGTVPSPRSIGLSGQGLQAPPEAQKNHEGLAESAVLSPTGRFLAIQGDITVHIPVLPPVAAQPLRVAWILHSSSPGLPTTQFSGALNIDDSALTWDKVTILYPQGVAETPESPPNSLRTEGNFHFEHGPTAQLNLHFQDVASLAHFGLPVPTANGPLDAAVRISAPTTVSVTIQSSTLALPQGVLQGLSLKLEASPTPPPSAQNTGLKNVAPKPAPQPEEGGKGPTKAASPPSPSATGLPMPAQPALTAPTPAWSVPNALNGTLELKVQSCMGFGPLNLSTTWGLENLTTKLGVRIADLHADMLGVKLRGGLAYTGGTFKDAALDLAITNTSAIAKLFNIPLKGCPLTFKARVAPDTKETAIKGQLNFGAGSYDRFAWLSGEGTMHMDSAKASLNLSVKGKLSARVRCSYIFADQVLRIDNVELGDSTLKLGAKLMEPTEIRFANGINIGDTTISLRPAGTVHIKGKLEAQGFDMQATVADIPLGMAKAFTTAPIPQGTLSARVGLKGSPSAPTGSAQMRVDNMQLANTVDGPQASLVVDGKLIHTAGKDMGKTGTSHTLQLQSHWEGLESLKNFTATAHLPLRFAPTPTLLMDGPLQANLSWQGDIAPLWRLVPLPGRSLSGKAEVQAIVKGSLRKPIVTGQAFVGQGRFVDAVDGLLLDGITLEALYDAQKQSVVRLQASDGRGGSLNIDGTLSAHPTALTAGGHTGDATLALRGIINKLRPLRRDDVAVQLSGTIDITGPLAAPLVAANLCVDQGLLQLLDGFGGSTRKNLAVEERNASAFVTALVPDATKPSPAPQNTTKSAKKHKGQPSTTAIKKGTSNMPPPASVAQVQTPAPPALVPRCDIRITAPGRLYIRGKGLDSEWKANLRMSGPLADPQIIGNVIPIRGNLELLGHQFTLTSGDIVFTGSLPPNPLLDVSLQYKSADITALIMFSGSAKQPKMRLSSQPVLPNDEIIAHILFGKNMNSLSRFEALQAANTARQLVDLGPSSLDIMTSTRDLLGLEVLRFGSAEASRKTRAPRDASMQGTSSANPDDQGPTIEAGKYILDNVYVGFEQGTDAKTGTIVRVEVELLPNLSLEGRTSNESTGVGVNWKRDY